jgi:uncharacterized membrane protein
MSDLIAIGYDDTTSAVSAMEAVDAMSEDLIIQPDAVAAIIRDGSGKFRTVGAGATWGLFWGLLFGLLIFNPVLGMAMGAAFGALGGKLAKDSISKEFQDQVRAALQPGTSALFMIVEEMTTDKALDQLSKFGGNVIKTSLSKDAEAEIQEHLHGTSGA